MDRGRLIGWVLSVLVACATSASCSDEDVGVRCKGSLASGSTQTGAFVVTQTTECQSRVCIETQGIQNPVPRCTKFCESDGDCTEQGPNCAEGFLCRVGAVNLTGLGCCKFCICKSDLTQAQRDRDEQAAVCEAQGVVPTCPQL